MRGCRELSECYEAAALLPRGSGFRVQGSVQNSTDMERGEGSRTLASVRALRLPSVTVQIFQTESQSTKFRVEVWSLEFGVWSLGEGLGAEVQGAGAKVRLYLKSYGQEPDDFNI